MAKLQMRDVIDDEIIDQTMEYVKRMESKHGEYIKTIDDPRDVALRADLRSY